MPMYSLYDSIATVSMQTANTRNVASWIWAESTVCSVASPGVAICGSLIDNRVHHNGMQKFVLDR